MSLFDLLTNSTTEQTVIRCLLRQPKLSVEEIVKYTHISRAELDALLGRMVYDSQLICHSYKGVSTYSVQFKAQERPRPSGLLDILYG